VAQLRQLKDDNIVFVTLGDPARTEEFRQSMKSPHRFICDPEKKLHAHFNLQRGGLAQMVTANVFVRGVNAVMKGHGVGAPVGDAWQMPGVFLIDPQGAVTWEHRARDAADNPSVEEVRSRLGEMPGSR
jgi:peroxiredoxin